MAVRDLKVGSSALSPRFVKRTKIKKAQKTVNNWLVDGGVIKSVWFEIGRLTL
jgi:hypothetical protein